VAYTEKENTINDLGCPESDGKESGKYFSGELFHLLHVSPFRKITETQIIEIT
jgi:hypothetical protein